MDNTDEVISLIEAAKSGDLTKVKEFIRNGVDVNQSSQGGSTALIEAAKNDKIFVVELLLRFITSEKAIYAALMSATNYKKTERLLKLKAGNYQAVFSSSHLVDIETASDSRLFKTFDARLLVPGLPKLVTVIQPKTDIRKWEELRISQDLAPHPSCPRVLGIFASSDGESTTGSLLERFEGQNILDLVSQGDIELSPSDRIQISIGICRCISHFHRNNYAHGAVTPPNFVLSNGRIFTRDYKFAHKLNEVASDDLLSYSYVSYSEWTWAAPEMLELNPPDKSTDVFMFGICLWVLWADLSCCSVDEFGFIFDGLRVTGDTSDMPFLERCPEQICDAVRKCCVVDEIRADIQDIEELLLECQGELKGTKSANIISPMQDLDSNLVEQSEMKIDSMEDPFETQFFSLNELTSIQDLSHQVCNTYSAGLASQHKTCPLIIQSMNDQLGILQILRKWSSHENVPNLVGICMNFPVDDQICPALLFEQPKGQSLSETLQRSVSSHIKFDTAVRIGMKILEIVTLFHSENRIICDIGLRSFWLAHSSDMRKEQPLIIFGLSLVKQLRENHPWRTALGSELYPWRYCAPETLESRISSKSSDVYMFGVTLWELLYTSFGEFPFIESHNPAEKLKQLSEAHEDGEAVPLDFQSSRSCPPKLKSLIEECCQFLSEDRPTVESVAASLKSILQDLPEQNYEDESSDVPHNSESFENPYIRYHNDRSDSKQEDPKEKLHLDYFSDHGDDDKHLQDGIKKRKNGVKGMLWKKNPHGPHHLRGWKLRFCTAHHGKISYYKKESDQDPAGEIMFEEITSVEVLDNKKPVGCRFDVYTTRGRIFEFRTERKRACEKWVDYLIYVCK